MPLTTSASTATNPISSRSIQQKTHLELFRYRWYNYISIRHDDCEKQVFDPAVSGISDGNEPMRDGLLAKCNAFDAAIVRPLMKAQHPPHGAVYYFLTDQSTAASLRSSRNPVRHGGRSAGLPVGLPHVSQLSAKNTRYSPHSPNFVLRDTCAGLSDPNRRPLIDIRQNSNND
jgi:hypothetical protein